MCLKLDYHLISEALWLEELGHSLNCVGAVTCILLLPITIVLLLGPDSQDDAFVRRAHCGSTASRHGEVSSLIYHWAWSHHYKFCLVNPDSSTIRPSRSVSLGSLNTAIHLIDVLLFLRPILLLNFHGVARIKTEIRRVRRIARSILSVNCSKFTNLFDLVCWSLTIVFINDLLY